MKKDPYAPLREQMSLNGSWPTGGTVPDYFGSDFPDSRTFQRDVKVPPDFLSQFVQPLRDPANGLVNSFYALVRPATRALPPGTQSIALAPDGRSVGLRLGPEGLQRIDPPLRFGG